MQLGLDEACATAVVNSSYFKPLIIVTVTLALRAASFVLRAALDIEFREGLSQVAELSVSRSRP